MHAHSKDALVVFEGTEIRRIWQDDEWFYSVSDIIGILTDSKDELADWRKQQRTLQFLKNPWDLKNGGNSAVEGGTIAENTHKELEQKTGKTVISSENYLHLTGKKQKKLVQKTANETGKREE